MFNSFRNAIVITVIALLICSIAGYGFEIYHDKGKDLLMNILLLAIDVYKRQVFGAQYVKASMVLVRGMDFYVPFCVSMLIVLAGHGVSYVRRQRKRA